MSNATESGKSDMAKHIAEQFTFPWSQVVENMRVTRRVVKRQGKPRAIRRDVHTLQLVFAFDGHPHPDVINVVHKS